MSTHDTVPHAAIAILNLPTRVPALVFYAQGVANGLENNPSFPKPSPSVAQILAAIAALNTAETAAMSRTKGAVLARNNAKAALGMLLKQARAYVQSVADGNAETSAAVIASANIAVRKTAVRAPRAFHAEQAAVSGAAKLVAPAAGHRASYDWQYSTDGGKTWIGAPSTLTAKTTVTGLPSGTTVQFRFRALTKAGVGDWSEPTSLLVR